MKDLWTLLLDCSFYGSTVALAKNNILTDSYTTDAARSSGEMHPQLEALLARQNMALADVDTLVVTVGPGSFTGIRLGLAFAEALKVAVPDVKTIGLGTLQALAAGYAGDKPVEVWVDAAGGQVFVQRFDAQRAPLSAPVCVALAEASAQRDTAFDLLVGMGVALTTVPDAVVGHVEPEALLKLAAHGVSEALEPMYIKPVEYRRADA